MPTQSTQPQQTLWHERILAQSRSGLPMAHFCRQHGLCIKTFYRWRARLGLAQPKPITPLAPKFLRVQMPAPRAQALIAIRLANGALLSVFDASVIPILLAALQ